MAQQVGDRSGHPRLVVPGTEDDTPDARYNPAQLPALYTRRNWPYNYDGAFINPADRNNGVWTGALEHPVGVLRPLLAGLILGYFSEDAVAYLARRFRLGRRARGLIAAALFWMLYVMSAMPFASGPALGAPAPAFALVDQSGKTVRQGAA